MAELSFNHVMIGSEQPDVLAEFYGRVFDRAPDMKDEGGSSWQSGTAWLSVGGHSEVKGRAAEPQRVILNLETTEVKEEFERIKAIAGATVVKEPYEIMDVWIATFADPDGNFFQLMAPWEGMTATAS